MVKSISVLEKSQELFRIDDSGAVVRDWEPLEGGILSRPIIIAPNDDMSWLEELSDEELEEKITKERDCSKSMECWQHQIRKKFDGGDGIEQLELMPEDISLEIKDTVLRKIPREVVKPFIEKYEWLGTLGTFKFGYGLFFGYKLGGVACFSKTTTWQAEVSICGEKYRDKVILLNRGACANWCPKGTNSHLIAQALKAVERDTQYRIILAYSDRRAGEVGTVYQATNWHFIGWGATGHDHVPKGLTDIDSVRFHTRGLPKELKSAKRLREAGYEVVKVARPNKGRYIYFLGSKKERKELLNSLRFRILPYPKREDFSNIKKLKRFDAKLKRGLG